MQDLRFDGRVAVITGAGGNPGLGRSYALLLAARGAKVLVNDLGVGPDGRGRVGAGGVDDVVEEIRAAGGVAIGNHGSVATRDGAREIVEAAVAEFGRVDIVINNAGIAPFALFDEIADSDVERVVGVHLMGHIWMCRAAWGHMRSQGYGRLVNVSSAVAALGMPQQSIYAAAKLGVVGLTRVLAAEGAAHGIVANTILPAADTLAWRTMLAPEFSARAREQGQIPEVVAPVAAWLAHETCTVTGKMIAARAGAISELYFSSTAGSEPRSDLTIEDVGAALPQITSRDGSRDLPDPSPTVPESMKPREYSAAQRSPGDLSVSRPLTGERA